MLKQNIRYNLHNTKLAWKSKAAQNIILHGVAIIFVQPLANMLVADSKPLTDSSLIVGTACNSKSIAAKNWSEPYEWIGQVILVDS